MTHDFPVDERYDDLAGYSDRCRECHVSPVLYRTRPVELMQEWQGRSLPATMCELCAIRWTQAHPANERCTCCEQRQDRCECNAGTCPLCNET